MWPNTAENPPGNRKLSVPWRFSVFTVVSAPSTNKALANETNRNNTPFKGSVMRLYKLRQHVAFNKAFIFEYLQEIIKIYN